MKLRYVFTLFAAVLLSLTASGATSTIGPSIIFILVDDLRWDEVGLSVRQSPEHPAYRPRGVRFQNAFITTPLCSQARELSHCAIRAQKRHHRQHRTAASAGYELVTSSPTARRVTRPRFLGKWHMGLDDNPRPGIDYWVSVKGQGSYLNPEFNVNGRHETKHATSPDILNDYARISEAEAHETVSPLHLAQSGTSRFDSERGRIYPIQARDKFIPAEHHRTFMLTPSFPHRPNYPKPPEANCPPPPNRRSTSAWSETVTDDETIRNRLRMLASVETVSPTFSKRSKTRAIDNHTHHFHERPRLLLCEHGLSWSDGLLRGINSHPVVHALA